MHVTGNPPHVDTVLREHAAEWDRLNPDREGSSSWWERRNSLLQAERESLLAQLTNERAAVVELRREVGELKGRVRVLEERGFRA